MIGRITSESEPARNEHNVPYHILLREEKNRSAQLIEKYREALKAWLKAERAPTCSRQRRQLLAEARILSESILA